MEEHRNTKCKCPDGNCPQKIPEEEYYKLRRNLQRMSQSGEANWRRDRLLAAVNMPSRGRRITYSSEQLCVFGFACLVGGPTYERVCYATLRDLQQASANEGKYIV